MAEMCDKLVSLGKANISLSAQKSESTHFPFEWPAGNPLGWAIFASSKEAVDVTCMKIEFQSKEGIKV